MNMPAKEIVFVFRRSQFRHGSTTMRAHQLCRQVAPHLPAGWRASLSGLPTPGFPLLQLLWAKRMKAGTALFVTKHAAKKLLPETLALLHRRRCVICLDYVDGDLRNMRAEGVDVHLSCSLAGKREMERLQAESRSSGRPITGRVGLLFHNVDSRLLGTGPLPGDRLRSVYFGSMRRAFLPEAVARRIEVLDAGNTQAARRSIARLADYNFHYCVSPAVSFAPRIVRRPFTKGFTAAAVGANVIVNRAVDDAVELLGADYPYLVQDLSEEAVLERLAFATESFGGPEWRLAAERMAELRRLVEPVALARQLVQIFSDAMR
ncbi:MAG TPA: hypothetical protein VFI92_16095 [Steroidobacteraceae bacterium]|nr:hypothetical protein [Steroidobacteraceae bacterium]